MMRVYDWAAHAKPRWFIPDGVHYTTDGYAARTRLIARALVKAFPRGRPPERELRGAVTRTDVARPVTAAIRAAAARPR